MNKFGRDLTWVGVIKVGVISVGSLTVVWCNTFLDSHRPILDCVGDGFELIYRMGQKHNIFSQPCK